MNENATDTENKSIAGNYYYYYYFKSLELQNQIKGRKNLQTKHKNDYTQARK